MSRPRPKRPPLPSPGSAPELLEKHIEKRAIVQSQAASELELSNSTLSEYLSGKSVPGGARQRLIEVWSEGDVPVVAWHTPEERAAFERVMARTA